MGVEVRTIVVGEAGAWLDQRGVGFLRREPEGSAQYFVETADLDRTRGAFDGTHIVGSLRSFATELTVPGPSSVPASALTNVTVAPTHRRRGVLTEMITGDLRDSKERGEAVSVLIASEYPIYGRFGYGPGAESATYTISTEGLRFVRPSVGTVELVDLHQLRELAPPVFERFRAGQPGSIGRDAEWWDRVLRQVPVPGVDPRKGFQAIYRSATGDVDGYVLYEGTLDFQDMRAMGTQTVEELTAATPEAYQALWEFCFGVDLLTTTTAANRSTDEVLPWLLEDARLVRLTGRHDFVWVRILDACASLASRRYGADARLVLEVRDEVGLTGGRFALEGGTEASTCVPTTDSADLTVPVRALGAALLGGVSWVRLDAAGLLDEHRAGAVRRAELMFRTPRAPWCTTWF
jgi:predicted acetyltransferase